MKMPTGYRDKEGYVKIAVEFPERLFSDIISMAQREGKGFGPMVVELCRVGKLDLEESDQHEPKEIA